MMEDKDVTIKYKNQDQIKEACVSDMAYTFMQGLINHNDLDLTSMHMNLQAMQAGGYVEAFAKFVMNKTNWSNIKQKMNMLPRIYSWFKARKELDLDHQTDTAPVTPTTEEIRYKVLVYETTENGVDRMKWKAPTVDLLLKEFAETKYVGIVTARDKEIAKTLTTTSIYEQKHFDKAKEIDRERIELGVQDILKKPVKQGRIASLDEYREKTEAVREQMLTDSAEILHDQIEDTSSIFSYEVLEKSDPANFIMGCLTDCCATLYGAGAGAMRAMIIHPDIQPLVVRDFDNKIISFGIIYVNREQGYAVVNDFEMNKKYVGKEKQRKAIYEKAMQGVRAFVEEYNTENPDKPIRRVTCGISPNWEAINDYIKQNPQSEILKAPNFNDFHYAGSSSAWSGDWHREQYEIWRMEDKNENELQF